MNDEIKKNRTSEVTIHLLQPDGTPLANREVQVVQTRHKFLFGTAAFDLVLLTKRCRKARCFSNGDTPHLRWVQV